MLDDLANSMLWFAQNCFRVFARHTEEIMDKHVDKGLTPLQIGILALGVSIAIIAVVNGIGHKVSTPVTQQQSK